MKNQGSQGTEITEIVIEAKEIPVNVLKPGMIFTEAVYIDDDNFLVPPGIAIKQRDLARLAAWGVNSVKTRGRLAKTPEAVADAVAKQSHIKSVVKNAANKNSKTGRAEPGKEPHKPNKPAESKRDAEALEENKGGYQEYTAFIQQLDRVFSNASTGKSLDASVINGLAKRLFNAIQGERSRFLGYILGGKIKGCEAAKSSINSAILSAMLAQEFTQPSHRIIQIVIGALLHDVGMFRLPKEILAKRGGLSQNEIRIMHTHPLYSYQLISKELNYPDSVGYVALQHHERWDGRGYPSKIAGLNIDIGARILSVADSFEAMVSQKPYRNSMVSYEAMQALLADNRSRFDPDILKAFVAIMGIYPIGSMVVLNNKAVARVTKVQPAAPLRPTVQVLMDPSGRKEQNGMEINLLAEQQYFISRVLKPAANRDA
ncbi:MAG: HD-GYP domain-containing protein [Treponema sp.]|nr:HD-GYP domain-containing protein [Treponema sp.]